MLTIFALWIAMGILFCFNQAAVHSKGEHIWKSCKINIRIGWEVPENVYRCEVDEKCCIEYAKPSCCALKPAYTIATEHLKFWGSLTLVLCAVAFFLRWKNTDLRICEEPSLSERLVKLVKKCTNCTKKSKTHVKEFKSSPML